MIPISENYVISDNGVSDRQQLPTVPTANNALEEGRTKTHRQIYSHEVTRPPNPRSCPPPSFVLAVALILIFVFFLLHLVLHPPEVGTLNHGYHF